jgi:hypothetical protein
MLISRLFEVGGENTMNVVLDLVIKTIQYTQCGLSRVSQYVYQECVSVSWCVPLDANPVNRATGHLNPVSC